MDQVQGGGGRGGNGTIIAVLVLVVIALAAFFAYQQGYFSGKNAEQPEIQINLPGGSPSGSGY